jgi:hypothetical protein
LKAKYLLTIAGFDFHGNTHRVRFSYKEDVRSEGNFMQSMRAQGGRFEGKPSANASEMMKLSFIQF